MRGAFRALAVRNYRLFFTGQTLSLIGTWMESIAMSWLVYRLTGSQILLGTVAFCSQIPAFLMSPLAGIVADRYDRRKLLMITQSLAAVEAYTLAAITLTGVVQPWMIVLTSVFIGIVGAFDMPTRQAFVPQLVEDKSILSNAIALNSTQFNIARLLGPAIAGITVAAVGEGYCFLINGLSFSAVLIALKMMRFKPHVKPDEKERPLARIKAGATYAWRHRPIRSLLQLMAITSLVIGVYAVLLPVFAKDTFHGDARVLGALTSAIAVGALIAAGMLAVRKSVVGLGRWTLIASITFNLGLIGLAVSPNLWCGLLSLVVVGFGVMKHMGATNTLIQTIVEDRMRGRVMSFYVMSFVGTMPIGSLLGGFISHGIGNHWTLAAAAVVGLVGSSIFWASMPAFRSVLRPIYEQMGIIQPAGQ